MVAASDGISNDADLSLGDQMQALSVAEWFGLIQRATDTLMNLVLHVKVMLIVLVILEWNVCQSNNYF